jgi:hypothetical protein
MSVCQRFLKREISIKNKKRQMRKKVFDKKVSFLKLMEKKVKSKKGRKK